MGGKAIPTPDRPAIPVPWTRQQQAILETLAAHGGGPMRIVDIANATEIEQPTVNSCLRRMAAMGVVTKVYRGEYALVPTASK